MNRPTIDFTRYTDHQLDLIYKATIGYMPIAENGIREEVIQILTEYQADPETDGVVIPDFK